LKRAAMSLPPRRQGRTPMAGRRLAIAWSLTHGGRSWPRHRAARQQGQALRCYLQRLIDQRRRRPAPQFRSHHHEPCGIYACNISPSHRSPSPRGTRQPALLIRVQRERAAVRRQRPFRNIGLTDSQLRAGRRIVATVGNRHDTCNRCGNAEQNQDPRRTFHFAGTFHCRDGAEVCDRCCRSCNRSCDH